ncbi:MAG: SH3 domain-containing protein [Rhodobacteraceae bacterium]|nr:SH3 domain-containing protein [Paracoccaceae bacterium]
MNKRISGVSAALLGAVLALPAAADYVTGLDATGDGFLALRSGPGTGFQMMSKMPPNTVLSVVERHSNWRRVELQDGRWGWAHSRYIAPGNPPRPGVIEPRHAGLEAVLIRQGSLYGLPNFGSDIVAWLPQGSRVVILQVIGGFVQVTDDRGRTGYVDMQSLVLAGQPHRPVGPTPDLLRNWSVYVNPRYGTVLEVPTDYFIAEPDAPAGDGRRYVSVDGRAELLVYARHNVGDYSIRDLSVIDQQSGGYDQITYKPVRRNWFVLSGYIGNDIFYRRVELSGTGIIHTFELRYPKADKAAFDAVVTRMSKAFARN